MAVVALEGGAVSRVVSGFPASKASSFPHTFFSFFFGEFFNADGVDVHGIWIDFWTLVVGVVSLDWVGGYRVSLKRWHLLCPIEF